MNDSFVYFRLRTTEYTRSRTARPLLGLVDMVMALALARVAILLVLLARHPEMGQAAGRLLPGPMLAWLTAAVVLAAQCGVRIIIPYPVHPYRRFCSRRAWLVRAVCYPLLSPAPIVLAVTAVAVGRPDWIPIGAVLYLAALLADWFGVARVGLLAAVAIAIALRLSDGAALAFFGTANVVMLVAASALRAFERLPVARRWTETQNPLVAKEIAALTYFRSDQVVAALNLCSSAFVIAVVLTSGKAVNNLAATRALLPLIPIFPIASVLFNMLGTDGAFIAQYRRYAERTSVYLRRKARWIIVWGYAVNVGIAAYFWSVAGARVAISYALAAAAALELTACLGVLCSVLLYQEKSVHYNYVSRLSEAAPKLVVLGYALIAVVVGVVATRVGEWGSAAVILVGVAVGTLVLPRVVPELIRRHGFGVSA